LNCNWNNLTILVAALLFTLSSRLQADEASVLIRQYCVDCHGAPDESPEGGFSLSTEFKSSPLRDSGPTLKKALHAIEGFEMPPSDSDQPSVEERKQLTDGIRQLLAKPSLSGQRDPGRPVLRRLTRLEYNNTVRDLLGLETDVFMFSERLPFERGHYQPQSKKMPDRLSMAAREYGAKYPVLLRDVSMPGDSRAEYGFSNRGDAQNLSPVRLRQYVRVAGEIAFHPELLSRAERMEELFPSARFRQMAVGPSQKSKPLASSETQLARNNNVGRTADGSAFTLDQFRKRVDSAFAEDCGGVFGGEELRNTKIAGKGGLVRVAYGKDAIRTFAINPNQDWWLAPFASANESSGDTLMANYQKGQRQYELSFQSTGGGQFAGIAEIGVVVLSRRGQEGTVRLKATYDDDTTAELAVKLKPGAGEDNTFASFAADDGRSIKRLLIDGSEFSGDYVLLDDLAFITRDEPNLQPLVQAEAPVVIEAQKQESPRAKLDRNIAKQPVEERMAHFLRRAFRRDVKREEVALYVDVYRAATASGADDELAMRSAIQAILSSPSFLYVTVAGLSEHGRRRKDSSASQRLATVTPLNDYELASRLSYFLWSSMPDAELFELAAQGKLQNDEVLEAQIHRMLSDTRSIELSENFLVQWLRLPELWTAQPDKRRFPEFYSGPLGKRTLARDMFGEVLLQFQTILVEDRAVTELLDAEYTFINSKLMQFYGRDVSNLETFTDAGTLVGDDQKNDRIWNRVRKFDEKRGGLLTSPAVLTLTSFPHRTSSIRRGVWILDTVFNRHPPAPKVAVADIDEQQDAAELTLREKVERHRENAACAVCHDRIDPPGFALENFDAIGRWRDKDGDDVIDPSGELPGIGEFRTPEEFRSLLLSEKRRFVQGFAEHLLSYALGRKLEYFDVPVVEQIVDRTIEDDYRISRLILETAMSYPFRHISPR
jgi:hypothetical protein